MNIAIVGDSSPEFMPYLENYTKVIMKNKTSYNTIIWDRLNIREQDEYTYTDSKTGHRRGIIDYYKYSQFVIKKLKKNNYDKIIIFGIPLVFFLKDFLIKKHSGHFVIDIRDHHRITRYFKIKNCIDHSAFTVLSSPGYKEWLPKSNKYVVNHNTKIGSLEELRDVEPFDRLIQNKISVGCIGALRDYKINIDFIESLKNNKMVQLNYHGEGDINEDISKYLLEYNIENVELTGRYTNKEEEDLYKKNNLINVLRYNDGINNKTALPNRVYNAPIYGKPMLAYEGTQLSNIIKKYGLGIVIDSFDNITTTISNYLNNIFDSYTYENGRKMFLKNVIKDNEIFENHIENFIQRKTISDTYEQDLGYYHDKH